MKMFSAFVSLLLLSQSAAVTRPHILLIVADDLGHNDVGFHSNGTTQVPTPNLDTLAHAGVQLDNYYVQPVCSPTRSCLMTGRHVIHSGIYDPDCGMSTTYAVPRNFTMIPKHLKALGYTTAAVGKWHLGYFSDDVIPTGRGFDTFFGYYGGAEDYNTHKVGKYLDIHDDVAGGSISPAVGYDGRYSTHIYTDRAVKIISTFGSELQQWKDEHSQRRHGSAAGNDGSSGSGAEEDEPSLFMYLAYQAIHSPDEAPQSYIDRFNSTIPNEHRRIVAGMISALDEGIGNVTIALRAAGLTDRTIIVFTTDNGGPAQGFNHNMASNWPLRGMKRTLWEGGVRGDGFVWGAGLKKTGYVSKAMLHATDLPISLLAVATNGLDLDPASEAWRDWQELLPAVHSVTTDGQSAAVDLSTAPFPSAFVSTSAEPPFQLGDGLDCWAAISTGSASPRTEIIHEAHPTAAGMHGKDDGNGQALRMGDMKLVFEKGPMWHGPPNDLWYDSYSEPEKYSHSITCGASGNTPPSNTTADYCHPDRLPCLFNVTADPCEYHDLSKAMPDQMAKMIARLRDYQATAVPKDFHHLVGVNCSDPDPSKHPEWNNSWMPFCAA